MLELAGLGSIMTIFVLLGIAAVASYGLTEIIKRGFLAWQKSKGKEDITSWWWNSVLRILAVVVGCGVGTVLMAWPLGAGLGLVGGALNTTIVAVVKKKLKDIVLKQEEE